MRKITTKGCTSIAGGADPRWNALNVVQAARSRLGLRDRDIAVLRGLLTFIRPESWESSLVVFASNASLQERCDGMDERTLRRRLAHLCEVGLIVRRQSPNRKRFVVRDRCGNIHLAYGFDLTPLRTGFARLKALAADYEAEQQLIKTLKAVLRDRIYTLATQGTQPEAADLTLASYRPLLRRKATIEQLRSAIRDLEGYMQSQMDRTQSDVSTTLLTDSDSQDDRHIERSEKEYIERRPAHELRPHAARIHGLENDMPDLTTCLDGAASAMEFATKRPESWGELNSLAEQLAPAIGICSSQMHAARDALGARGAAIAVLGLVEAFARIRDPRRYFQALTLKAKEGRINVSRMFRSLIGKGRFPAGNRGAVADMVGSFE